VLIQNIDLESRDTEPFGRLEVRGECQRAGRILIVEDDRHIARLLDFVLRRAGYELTVANTAEQALTELESCKPDALLLDLVLPGMTGLEFLRVVRSRSHFASCVVIVLSGHWFEQTDATLFEAGATAQCAKPIAPSSLLRKLRDFGVTALMPQEI
jgi:DNA-binding response OmpR family regulator